jgi:hypothetical protein
MDTIANKGKTGARSLASGSRTQSDTCGGESANARAQSRAFVDFE